MKWDMVTRLKSAQLIKKYEELRGYTFPQSFKDCVALNNGGCPMLTGFDTEQTEGRVFGFLYSFNKREKDSTTIWDSVKTYEIWAQDAKACGDSEWLNDINYVFQNYVAFASTPFGDEIAFSKADDSIVFIDHETLDIEKAADSFEEFIDNLYEEDDDEFDDDEFDDDEFDDDEFDDDEFDDDEFDDDEFDDDEFDDDDDFE